MEPSDESKQTDEQAGHSGSTGEAVKPPEESADAGKVYIDPTGKITSAIGKWLLVAFFMPILLSGAGVSSKLLFLNIEILLKDGVSLMLKFQCLYPLIAGGLAIILAKKERSTGKAFAIFALGLLPFLLLLGDNEVQSAFGRLVSRVQGNFSMGTNLILSTAAIIAILAGAHAVRIKPQKNIAAFTAAGGAALYLLLLLIPVNGQFPFLAPFKVMASRDGSGAGFVFLSGLAALLALVFMVIAAVRCLLLLRQSSVYKRVGHGKSILHLWFAQFYVFGALFIYFMLIGLNKGGSGGGIILLAFIMSIVKFFPWIIGLFLLIPLGIAEFMLQGPEPVFSPESKKIR